MINAPFENCKEAKLRYADSIQSCGAMLVIERDSGRICAASANAKIWFGMPSHRLLGAAWSEVLPVEMRVTLQSLLNDWKAPGSTSVKFRALLHQGRSIVAALNLAGPHLILELEESEIPRFGEHEQILASALTKLGSAKTEEAAASAIMRQTASIVGYDRVLLYRFLPDWHGTVIDEVLRPGVESFLGLHFPAGDVPENTRDIYLVKHQRMIPDVEADSIPIHSTKAGLRIDLSRSELRAVHPVHLQYLRNMGVRASFSVAVVTSGHLWGLIACHHLAPQTISFAKRQLCELLATMASIQISGLQSLGYEQERHAHHLARTDFRKQLQISQCGKLAIAEGLEHIRSTFRAQGVWARLDERDHYCGIIPDEASLGVLDDWLDSYGRAGVLSYDGIPTVLKDQLSLVRLASGLLYIPLEGPDFIVLLRSEQRENVAWAGKPTDDSEITAADLPLTPRMSFKVWHETTRGRAVPWLRTDIDAAASLRDMLIEFFEHEDLERRALTDPLTGLFNRATFQNKLREAVEQGLRDKTLSALLLVDLDHFKPINDTYGHPTGDALLREVTERMRHQTRGKDVIARLGGDEFAILLFGIDSDVAVEMFATRVLAAIREPYQMVRQKLEVSASIGGAICPLHATTEDQLIECADLALYQVKRTGKNGFRLFDVSMLP